jgi:hypothetical protein
MRERAPPNAVAGSVSAGELASLRRRATGSDVGLHRHTNQAAAGPIGRRRRGRERGASYSDRYRRRGAYPKRSAEASDRSESPQRGSVPRVREGAPEHRPKCHRRWATNQHERRHTGPFSSNA